MCPPALHGGQTFLFENFEQFSSKNFEELSSLSFMFSAARMSSNFSDAHVENFHLPWAQRDVLLEEINFKQVFEL